MTSELTKLELETPGQTGQLQNPRQFVDFIIQSCGLHWQFGADRKVLKMAYRLLRVARASAELRTDIMARTSVIQDPAKTYIASIALALYWRHQKPWNAAIRFVGNCVHLSWLAVRGWAVTLGMLVRPRRQYRLPARGTMSSVSYQRLEC